MKARLLVALLLVASTLVVYAPVAQYDFVNLDDDVYVTRNPSVRAGLTLEGVRWAFTNGHASLWHPLTWISHMLDVRLYGLEPGGHHLTNVYLHALNGVLLLLVLTQMTGAFWRSAAVATLFALHPLRVESVAWISERKDLLAALFGLLTLWAYAAYVKQPSRRRFALVTLCFALGLLAKPMLVTLPFALLLLDYWPLGRFAQGTDGRRTFPWLLLEKLPLVVLGLGASVVAFFVALRGGAVQGLEYSVGARVSNALVSYARYVEKTLWPVDLAVFYPLPHAWAPWQVVGAVWLLLGITALAVAGGRLHRYLPVGWLWFLGTLVPVIGLVQAGRQSMADRFTYLPHVGLFVAVVWGLSDVCPRGSRREPLLLGVGVIVVALLAIGSRWQLAYWKDSPTLFEHAVAVTDGNWFAHNDLGEALASQGKLEEATAHFFEALRLKPDYANAEFNLGLSLEVAGRTDDAVAHYERALSLDPSWLGAHVNLGRILLSQGKVDLAIDHLTEAVRLQPDSPKAHFNLALASSQRGDASAAIAHYIQALRLEPDFAEAHYQLAMLLAGQGRILEAGPHFARAWELRPR
jgi:tetratricopeptide (TPR) repeat protein